MNKKVGGLVIVAILLVTGIYYASPYWTVYQMKSAAQAGEGDRLSRYIDFPALKESFKSQMQAMLAKTMDRPELKFNPFAGIGTLFAGSMVNTAVDTMVTPESLAAMISGGKAKLAVLPTGPAPDKKMADGKPPRTNYFYEGLDVFKVELLDSEADKVMVTWVLHRNGLFAWKLTSMRLADF